MNMPEADVLATMTEEMHHLFMVNGCDPTCHCCNKKISVGMGYKLGHVTKQNCIEASKLKCYRLFKSDDEHDVMLCESVNCSPHAMIINKIKKLKEYDSNGLSPYGYSLRRGGCSIVNGVIVV
jgi:hypothetical protein